MFLKYVSYAHQGCIFLNQNYSKKKKKLYCEILLQLKMTVFCLNIFQNIIYTCDKVEFSVSIDPWFFRNHFYVLIWCL